MRLLTISVRNVNQRRLTSLLTTFSILVGTALVSFLWIAANQTEERYARASRGYSAILGAQGNSPLGIVLATVFNVGQSQGVIPLSVYREVHDDRSKWGRWVRYAIPLAVGDNFKGFRIVGTTDEWFTKFGASNAHEQRPRELRFAAGRSFAFGHADLLAEAAHQAERASGHDTDEEDIPPAWREVVLGARVARELGLGLSDTIVPAHGVAGGGFEEHAEAACRVVGTLSVTGTAVDRALYIPLGLFYRIRGHAAVGGDTAKAEAGQVEISAVIVNTRSPLGSFRLRSEFQRRAEAQVAIPDAEIRALFEVVGSVTVVLRGMSLLVLVVAAIGVFISLYNTMSERRRDVAILRSLGARRRQILGIVLGEALVVTGLGAILGVMGAHAAAGLLGPRIHGLTGVELSAAAFGAGELWLILGVAALGGLAGLLPAIQASMTDVARYLSAER